MKNILFDKKVRKKNKSFWDYFSFTRYYEREDISFKEKLYTFLYNMEKTGYTTKGESNWCFRMIEMDCKIYLKVKEQFEKDYKEFTMNINEITQ